MNTVVVVQSRPRHHVFELFLATSRSMSWAPLASCAFVSLVITTIVRYGSEPSQALTGAGLVAALVAAGVATYTISERRGERAGEVGALFTFGWFVSGRVVPDWPLLDEVVFAWRDRPWVVIAVAGLVTFAVGRQRRWPPRRSSVSPRGHLF